MWLAGRHVKRSGRCSWGEESPDKLVDEPEFECDDALEWVESDFASRFWDLYSDGIGK